MAEQWHLCCNSATLKRVLPGASRLEPAREVEMEDGNVGNHRDHLDRAVAARNGERLHAGQLHLRTAGCRRRAVSGAIGQRPESLTRPGTRRTGSRSVLLTCTRGAQTLKSTPVPSCNGGFGREPHTIASLIFRTV